MTEQALINNIAEAAHVWNACCQRFIELQPNAYFASGVKQSNKAATDTFTALHDLDKAVDAYNEFMRIIICLRRYQ